MKIVSPAMIASLHSATSMMDAISFNAARIFVEQLSGQVVREEETSHEDCCYHNHGIESDGEGTRAYRNFLIIVPDAATTRHAAGRDGAGAAALAHRLIGEGFVYVARAGQAEMEDDALGVRFLPLRDSLPAFGTMTAVIAIGDSTWAMRAASTYPDAVILLVERALEEKKRASRRRSSSLKDGAEKGNRCEARHPLRH